MLILTPSFSSLAVSSGGERDSANEMPNNVSSIDRHFFGIGLQSTPTGPQDPRLTLLSSSQVFHKQTLDRKS